MVFRDKCLKGYTHGEQDVGRSAGEGANTFTVYIYSERVCKSVDVEV